MLQQPALQGKSSSPEVYFQTRNKTKTEEENERKKAHTFTVPCSSLKRRERLAASISGVGLSRICLHHCKGLRDFSGEGKTFDEPIYNLKKKTERNLHYRYATG